MKTNQMKTKVLLYVLVIAAVVFAGCGEKAPNIGIEINWKGPLGWVPFISNDMGTKDSRAIEVIVNNIDRSYVEGITLRVKSNIPNFMISPDNAAVMALGPEGSSKSNPSIFKLETQNTPPGKYSIWVSAEYNERTIKNEELEIDIG